MLEVGIIEPVEEYEWIRSMVVLLDTPTTLRGGVNECGALFPKTSLLHKTH
jgi:hypothetical protein